MSLLQLESQVKNNNFIQQLKDAGFIFPQYEKYCLSNIPKTIFSLFGISQERDPLSELWRSKINIKKTKNVILLLLDGFGFNQWSRASDYEFFRKIKKYGVVFPITSIFPSTTSAALTTINSGLTPQEHGLLEWWVYFDEIDKIVTTLPFTLIGERGTDKLLDSDVDPKILFNKKAVYQSLKGYGINSFVFTGDSYSSSSYSKLTHRGSVVQSYVSSSDLMVKLRRALLNANIPSYFYVYWSVTDTISHKYGLYTEEYLAELNSFSYLLQEEFLKKIDKKTAKETMVLITSDHGHTNAASDKTIYLNRYRQLSDNLAISQKGNKILPWGSPRDMFMRVKPEKLDFVLGFLTKILKHKAVVLKTEQAIKYGLFGQGKHHEKFKDRAGNLLVLPKKNYTVWYKHYKGEEKKIRKTIGIHGGLSSDEMMIPFGIARMADLID